MATYQNPVLRVEQDFDVESAKTWMMANTKLAVFYAAAYLCCIYVGQRAMRHRKPMSLRPALILWSGSLASFSVLGMLRFVPVALSSLRTKGIQEFLCDASFYREVPSGFWSYAFTISKLYEFGDTAFIILRKQKLTFLHWYHHVSVMLYCWHGYAYDSPTGQAFGGMNYAVHSVMYCYFTLKAMKVSMPRSFNICITFLQLSQMFVGVFITMALYSYKVQGIACSESWRTVYGAMVMYLSYLILFLNFFYCTYIKRNKPALTPTTNGHYSNGTKHKIQ